MSSSQCGRVCQYACVRRNKDVSRTASVLGEEIEKCSQQASARAPAPIFIFGSGRALARRRAVTIARTPSACVVEGQLAWYRTPAG